MFKIVSIDKNVTSLRSSLGFQKYRDLKNNFCRMIDYASIKWLLTKITDLGNWREKKHFRN